MNRDEVLRMMLSKNTTPAEFEFDKLTAPPVEYFLSPQDLNRLVYLANNPRLSAKIDYKYDEIDKIMKARGFKLLGRGTNRVVYRYLENNTICLKIAVDHIGASDNPHEFINQEYLKPFVSKVYSVDPTGTVAVCERVHGIQTREEFCQYAPGIFDLIYKWFTSKYVVNDIGSKFFMNWGIRYSTGIPVLLDYPYFYELDIHKAKCMSILDDGTICCGDIDYDDGYNQLQCTKCGREYRAIELAKDVESGAVKIIGKGDTQRMKITLKKNGKVYKEIQVNPETKKIDAQYASQQATAKVIVKSVLDQERKAQKTAPAEEEKKNKVAAPQVKLKSTTGRVSIVINKTNDNGEPVKYNTEGKFIPKHKSDQQNKANKKQTVVKKKITINPNAEKFNYANNRIVNEPFPQVKVKVNGKAITEEPIIDEKVEEPTVDTKVEEVPIAEAETVSMLVSTMNANNRSVSQEALEKALDTVSKPLVVEAISDGSEPEVIENTKSEEVSAEAEDNNISEDEGDLNASIANAISEAISESTDSVIDAIDNSDNPDPDLEEVMRAEEEIRKEKEESKKHKKNNSKKYDPKFYKK